MAIINQLDLENLLQIDVTAEPDTTVTSYLVQAQAAAEVYCQRHFDYALANVETFDGDGREAIIQVDRWPIDTVTTVVESGVTLTVDQDYILYTARGWVMRTSGGARQSRGWRDHLRGIVITYDGGYVLEGGGSGAAVPDDLTLAITRIAGRLFRSGSGPIAGGPISSTTLDGIGSVGYAASSVTAPVKVTDLVLLDEEMAALDPYSNPGLA